MSVTFIKLDELKAGDEVPDDAVIADMYLPVFGPEGEVSFVHLRNVPVLLLVSDAGEPQSERGSPR